jgi:hypothetical protein
MSIVIDIGFVLYSGKLKSKTPLHFSILKMYYIPSKENFKGVVGIFFIFGDFFQAS